MTNKKDHLRIIGDVHGWIDEKHPERYIPNKNSPYKMGSYLDITRDCEYSIQLGDMGFNYKALQKLRPKGHHIFFPGNHDNYDSLKKVNDIYFPSTGMNFGYDRHGGISYFYVRGAFSIDKEYRLADERRTNYKSWWEEEELIYSEAQKCLSLYELVRPDLVITHSCPHSIQKMLSTRTLIDFGFDSVTFRTNTGMLLQTMLDTHSPTKWFFGHFHRDWEKKVQGTHFYCVGELSWVTLDKKGNLA